MKPEQGLDKKVHTMDKEPPPADPKNQYLSAGVVSGIATVSIGTVLGFSAILLPQLGQEVDLSKDEAAG